MLGVDGKMLGLDENGVAAMCFFLANLFTELTVHACNMFYSSEAHITDGL